MALEDQVPYSTGTTANSSQRNAKTTERMRMNAHRSVNVGTRFTTKIRTTFIQKDGVDIKDTEEAKSVLSTWCLRRTEDKNFDDVVAINYKKILEEIGSHTTEVVYVFDDNLEETARKLANARTKRIVLGIFPVIPKDFRLDGHDYSIKSSTEEKTHSEWIVPSSGMGISTIGWDEVQPNDAGISHHYPDKLVRKWIETFRSSCGPEFRIDTDDDGDTIAVLRLGGKDFCQYKKRKLSAPVESIVEDFF